MARRAVAAEELLDGVVHRFRVGHGHREPSARDLDVGRGDQILRESFGAVVGDTAVGGVDHQCGTGDFAQAADHRLAAEQTARGDFDAAAVAHQPAFGPDGAVPVVVADQPVRQLIDRTPAGFVVIPLVQEFLGRRRLFRSRPVRFGADECQRRNSFGCDQRGAQRRDAALCGAAEYGALGAEVVQHGERVAGRGPVGERQALIPGAAMSARVPGDDAEFRCQRCHLRREHRTVHEEFVRQ